jgi:hypothetical protein
MNRKQKDMQWLEKNVFEVLPRRWWHDFTALVRGEDTSPEFDNYFDESPECRAIFEKTVRYLDRDLTKLLQAAFR